MDTAEAMVMVTAGGMDMAIHPAMATCHRREERLPCMQVSERPECEVLPTMWQLYPSLMCRHPLKPLFISHKTRAFSNRVSYAKFPPVWAYSPKL